MSTSCSIVSALSLSVCLALSIIGLTLLSSQTIDGQTRPRTLSSSTEDSAESPTETDRQSPPGASSEAKRLYKAGVQYREAGLFTQAAELFQRALKLKPDYGDAYRSLGQAYLDLKQSDDAVRCLEHSLALNPKDKHARVLLQQARWMLDSETGEGSKEPIISEGSQASINVTSPIPTAKAVNVSATESSLTRVYRVGPGDVLDVRAGETPAAESIALTVTPSGLLELPGLAAPLSVAGLTVEEISARLELALKGRPAAPDASVSVGVRDYVSHTILVSGLVKEPGTKILRRESIPLSVVLADAQPLPEAAKAVVVRNETNESFMIDLEQTAEITMLVRPGDVVTLRADPAQFFYVSGEVKAPGEKLFRRGLTLTQAIITAGGLTGKSKEARLARDDGKGFLIVTRYKLKEIESGKLPDPPIQPGDRITIVK